MNKLSFYLNESDLDNLFKTHKAVKQVELSSSDIKNIENLKWQDIKVDAEPKEKGFLFDIEFPDNLQFLNDSIFVKGTLIKDLLQLDVILTSNLQKRKIAHKIIRSILEEFGNVYGGKGRIQNPLIYKLFKNIAEDSKISLYEKNGSLLLLHKDNPEYSTLLNTFMKLKLNN